MNVPYIKAHGARNDFLLTWAAEAPSEGLPQLAEAICDRYTGAGGDGWLLVSPAAEGADYDCRIRLFNPDGGEVEMSGNGTRCAAAFLLYAGLKKDRIVILTGAGNKQLTLLGQNGLEWNFEMNMSRPKVDDANIRFQLPFRGGVREVTLMDVGNPQCAVFVDDFDFDWRAMGAELEQHPHFPNRSNVSFIRSVDEHMIDVRFFERGAGVTMSSGTGSTGAVVASVLTGIAKSPVRVLTLAGPLDLKWEARSADVLLTGPAAIVSQGQFFYNA